MRITPATVWACLLGLSALLWFVANEYRVALGVILTAHVPVLIWGIWNIRSQFFGEVLCGRPDAGSMVALTFDDGPDPALTPAVLDILKEFGYQATFFVIAQAARRHPAIVREIAAEGHVVASHDLTHTPLGNFRRGAHMTRELEQARDIISEVAGAAPLLYRPPVGLLNPHVHPALQRLGMRCIGWNTSAHDWGNRRRMGIKKIPHLARPGAVILLHDRAPANPEYRELFLRNLRALFESIRAQDLEPVTIDRFFEVPAYAPQQTAQATESQTNTH
jgi:peptidoglycan-N-acetylglucosamine deacetylase